MKTLIAALLILTLSSPATAEESACAKGYRLANAEFYSQMQNLAIAENAASMVKYGSIPGGLACFLLSRRNLWTFAGCSILGSVAFGGGHVGQKAAAGAQVRLEGMQQQEDAYLIYQIYRDWTAGEHETSKNLEILLNGLQVEGLTADHAGQAVVELMDSGELCGGGDQPSVDYWTMLDLVKARL